MRKAANEEKQRNVGQTKQSRDRGREGRIERTVFRDSGKPMETHLRERRKLNNRRKTEKTEDNSSFSLEVIHQFRSDETSTLFKLFFFPTECRGRELFPDITQNVSSSLCNAHVFIYL